MNKNIYLILFYLLLSNIFCFSRTNNPSINTYQQFIHEFYNPNIDYRPAPLWVWNNVLSEEFINENLKEFKKAGIGAVYIHPRTGLQFEYLSDEWFKWVKYTLKVAQELGLKVWIYDEYVCPSGFAGGIVPSCMPESYNQGTGLVAEHLTSLDELSDKTTAKYFYKRINNQWINITQNYKTEEKNKGKFLVFNLLSEPTGKGGYGGYAYVDLLARGVTDKFKEVTMTGYEKVGKKYFGNLISGIMTDEPSIGPYAGGIRYTPDLFTEFKRRWGYSLEDYLPLLIEETGEYKRVRHNYRTVLLEMYINRWSKPWYDYTEKNNLIWTGHYWENIWPDLYMGPDNMAMYAWHQMPGVDMLMNSTEKRPDQFGNNIAIKELGSVRNQFDRHRAFSETYGGSGWDLSFEDMKRNGDWQYALGVNYLNMHLSLTSLVGVRKCDYPQSFMPYSPYWNLFKYPMDYFARLSVAMSSGKQINKILVIEPTTTVWMYYPDEKMKQNIGKSFKGFINKLEEYQIEYDLGCENIIAAKGTIKGNQFGINKRFYDLVVLENSIENLDSKTIELLKEYVKNGGKVLQLGNNLKYKDGIEDASLAEMVSAKNWIQKNNLTQDVVSKYFISNKFYMTPSVSGRIHHQRRIMDDGEILFVSNFCKDSYAGTNVFVEGMSVEQLIEETGKTKPIHYVPHGKSINFTVTLPPSGSALYYIHKNKKVPSAVDQETKLEKINTVGDTKVQRVQPNILVLDYLTLTIKNNKEMKDIYYYTANKEVFNYFGFKHDPWEDVQFKTEFMDKNKDYKNGDSFQVEYSFDLSEKVDTKSMQLVVERGDMYHVSINGQKIKPDGSHWLDQDFKCFNISNKCKPGKNIVAVSINKFNVLCEISPVYILGNFSLKSEAKGWSIIQNHEMKTGDWKSQGAPFYPGEVSYSKTFDITKEGEYLVSLPNWNGTVAEIKLNGNSAGIISTQPYEKSLTLNKGKNKITIIVYGSLRNLFGPHHVPSEGYIRPASFYKGKIIQPEGNSYILPKNGMNEDFQLYRVF